MRHERGTYTARWPNKHPCSLWRLLDPFNQSPVFPLIPEKDFSTISNLILVAHPSIKHLAGHILQSLNKILEIPTELAADELFCGAPLYHKAWYPYASRCGARDGGGVGWCAVGRGIHVGLHLLRPAAFRSGESTFRRSYGVQGLGVRKAQRSVLDNVPEVTMPVGGCHPPSTGVADD